MTLADVFCAIEPAKPDSVAGYTVRLRTTLHSIESAWHHDGDSAALPAIRKLAEIAVAALVQHGFPEREPTPGQGEQIAIAATFIGTPEMRTDAVERLKAYRRDKAIADAIATLAAVNLTLKPELLQ